MTNYPKINTNRKDRQKRYGLTHAQIHTHTFTHIHIHRSACLICFSCPEEVMSPHQISGYLFEQLRTGGKGASLLDRPRLTNERERQGERKKRPEHLLSMSKTWPSLLRQPEPEWPSGECLFRLSCFGFLVPNYRDICQVPIPSNVPKNR